MSPLFSHKIPRKTNSIACVFVHAGAGYHSEQNEHLHLRALADAASLATNVLKAGGVALDACEIAAKVLEDREITNAGYGSNLSMDGIVECDAVIVDHYGRSGACGAVSQIKNPVSLARLIHDATLKPLSLRRVPPNLLVGQGATDFAAQSGMDIIDFPKLISPGAQERWIRWTQDLAIARHKDTNKKLSLKPTNPSEGYTQFRNQLQAEERYRKAHIARMEAATVDKRPEQKQIQPDSISETSSKSSKRTNTSSLLDAQRSSTSTLPTGGSPLSKESSPGRLEKAWTSTSSSLRDDSSAGTAANGASDLHDAPHLPTEMSDAEEEVDHSVLLSQPEGIWNDSSSDSDWSEDTERSLVLPSVTPSPAPRSPVPNARKRARLNSESKKVEDLITDTIGVIAIDDYGHIACCASSGGISMKHRGRAGPAALVGVGASIAPVDPNDGEKTTVAVVTSGTGEHMATTVSAAIFADRLYNGVKRGRGRSLEECSNDDEIVNSVITREFMGHPSVENSHSKGAIGVLCVKMTKDGINLHFAHNTDSFALASQHVGDPEPKCTMSRKYGTAETAWGGTITKIGRRRRKP